MVGIGDSTTLGVGASSPANCWVGLFTPATICASGWQYADMVNAVEGFRAPPTPPVAPVPIDGTQWYVFDGGINDHRTYRGDPVKQELFACFLRRALAYFATPAKVLARGMTRVGSWTNMVTNAFGLACTAPGCRLSCSVPGNSVYVGYTIQNASNAHGVADVKIDGALAGTLNTWGAMTTAKGATFAGACQRFGGLAPGDHEVEIVTDQEAGQWFYLDWVAGNLQPATPLIRLYDIPRMSAAAYSLYGSSDALVDAYNQILYTVAGELAEDEFDVGLAMIHDSIDPSLHLGSDGVHYNDAGYDLLARVMRGAIAG